MPRGMFKKPCLDCGKLTDGGSRCNQHAEQYKIKRNARLDSVQRIAKKRLKYNPEYQRRARQVRQAARMTPTQCHICKRIIQPHEQVNADHLYPELLNASPLAPAHARCNQSRGNKPLKDL
jgi:hypothetical protein